MEHLQSRMEYAVRLFRTAEYEEAKIILTSLLKTYKKKRATKEVCLCLYGLACIAYVRGEIQTFNDLCTQYEKLRTLVDDLQLQVEYYVLRGLSELSLQHYEQAITEFTHVLSLAREVQFTKQKVSAFLYMQKCHILLERYEASLQMSEEIWRLYDKVIQPDTGQFFHYMLNQANTLLALGQLTEIDSLLVQCEEHIDYTIMPVEQIQTMVSRAKLHLAKQESKRAIVILERAQLLAHDLEDVNVLSEVYEALVENYEALDKPKEALACAKKRLELHKELTKK